MWDSKFWRLMATLLVVGVFYVGYGLNDGPGGNTMAFIGRAQAGGVAVMNGRLYTATPDGLTLHAWRIDDKGKMHYLGSAIGQMPSQGH